MPKVKCKDIEMYYEIAGEGRPLLLIHGLGNDLRSWNKVAPHLSKSFQLIKIDLRGSGRTDKPEGPYTIEGMAGDLINAIDVLGYERVDVAGFSMGGCVAISLALDHAEKVDRLALISTTPAWSRPYPFTKRSQEIFSQTVVTPKLLKDVYELIYGENHRKKFTAKDYTRYRMDDPYPQTVEAYIGQLKALKQFDRADEVHKIMAQTFIVAGRADRVIPTETSSWLKEKIGASSLQILEGVGHMVIEEAPKQLANFLREV